MILALEKWETDRFEISHGVKIVDEFVNCSLILTPAYIAWKGVFPSGLFKLFLNQMLMYIDIIITYDTLVCKQANCLTD